MLANLVPKRLSDVPWKYVKIVIILHLEYSYSHLLILLKRNGVEPGILQSRVALKYDVHCVCREFLPPSSFWMKTNEITID